MKVRAFTNSVMNYTDVAPPPSSFSTSLPCSYVPSLPSLTSFAAPVCFLNTMWVHCLFSLWWRYISLFASVPRL